MRTLQPLAVEIDTDALDFALVLEDMAESEAGDQFTEATDAELALAIEQAAALHGPLWGADHPALAHLATSDPDRGSTRDLLSMFLPPCLDRLGGRLHDHTVPVLERFVDLADIWVDRPVETAGLLHSDFRPDNFLFGRTPEAPPLAVVDWVTVTLGASVTDVAYLLGAAIDPGVAETSSMTCWRPTKPSGRLRRHYPADRCWDEYRWGCTVPWSASSPRSWRPRPTRDLFALMLNRHAQHALDVEALERVAALGNCRPKPTPLTEFEPLGDLGHHGDLRGPIRPRGEVERLRSGIDIGAETRRCHLPCPSACTSRRVRMAGHRTWPCPAQRVIGRGSISPTPTHV